MSIQKQLKQLQQKYAARGWSFQYTGAGHFKCSHAKGFTHIGSTLSDRRAIQNIEAQLRRIERGITKQHREYAHA